jgi:hypothetical protein
MARIRADREVGERLGDGAVARLPRVGLGLRDHVARVAFDVGRLDRVADETRHAFLVAREIAQVLDADVLRAREERDRVVASAAVARRHRTVLRRHHALDRLERRIHRRVAMRARLPFAVDLLVAVRRAARRRPGERARVEALARRGLRETGRERTGVAVGRALVVVRERVVPTRRAHEQRRAGRDREERGAHGEREDAVAVHGSRRRRGLRATLAQDERNQVPRAEEHDRDGRDDVHRSPGVADARRQRGFEREHPTRDRAHEERRHGDPTRELGERGRKRPIARRVPPQVDRDRRRRDDARESVHDHRVLIEDAEGQDPDREPAQRQEQSQAVRPLRPALRPTLLAPFDPGLTLEMLHGNLRRLRPRL